MVIICGHETVAAERREAVLEQFADMIGRARRFDGCMEFALSADPVDGGRINVVEIWRDEDALASWRREADAPDVGDVFLSMDVKRYDASDGGPLF